MAMAGCRLIGRAVVPGAGCFEGWELGDHDTLNIRPFQRDMLAVCGQHFEWMTIHRFLTLAQ
jgi:hypothetical protein